MTKFNSVFTNIYIKYLYTFFYNFYYNYSNISLLSLLYVFNLNKRSSIFRLISFKKAGSVLKKKPQYLTFFRIARPRILNSAKQLNNLKLFISKKKPKMQRSLFTKRPYEGRKIKKKLLTIRRYFKKLILYKNYDSRVTKHINRLKSKSAVAINYQFNYNIIAVLRRLYFAQTIVDARSLTYEGYIFINRANTIHKNTIIKIGDIIELYINIHYIYYNKYINMITMKNVFRYLYRMRSRFLTKKEKAEKEKRINKSILRFNSEWTSAYLNNFEINYHCLTAIYIYKHTYTMSDFFKNSLYSLYIYRLYNWGYYM